MISRLFRHFMHRTIASSRDGATATASGTFVSGTIPDGIARRLAGPARLAAASTVAAALVVGVAACAGPSPECRVGADCESGACSALGLCVDSSNSSSASSSSQGSGGSNQGGGSSVGGSGAGGSGQGGSGQGGSGQGGGGLCSPNGDGVIERNEVLLQAGLSAKFLAAQDASWDTGGALQGDGSYNWDLSVALSNDHQALVETLPIAGSWYADVFPGASYASKLRDDADLLGVFEVTPQALLLRGVVSPADGFTRTELEYDPPVTVLSFPFSQGDSWQTQSTVSGLAVGVFSIYSEDYVSSVDKAGAMVTPFGTFNVLRVHVALERTVGLLVTDIQTHAFVAECFGTIATVASQDNETNVEFNNVAEVRRLTP